MASDQPRGIQQLVSAFCWSMQGLRAALKHEASFRLECYVVVILLPLGLWLGHGVMEKLWLVMPLLLLLIVELLNSAIEAVVDMVSPEWHKLAGRAKDLGSAAVFVCLVLIALSWLLIVYTHIF